MVIYPDIEPYIVDYLNTRLSEIDEPIAYGVRVGTLKSPPDAIQPPKQVVVTGNYQGDLDDVRRSAELLLEIYCDSYSDASNLALLVSALIIQIPDTPIKRAVVTLGPVRLSEEGTQEKRAVTVDLVVKGTEF